VNHPTCETCEYFDLCTDEACETPGPHGYCYVNPDPAYFPQDDASVRYAVRADRPACRFHQDLVMRAMHRLQVAQVSAMKGRCDA